MRLPRLLSAIAMTGVVTATGSALANNSSPATCACPPLPGLSPEKTYAGPDAVDFSLLPSIRVGEGVAMVYGINFFAQTALEIDARWTGTAIPRTFTWELHDGLPGATPPPVASGQLVISDATTGSGAGALRLDILQSLAIDRVHYLVLRQVEASAPGESTLEWLAGDVGDPAPYFPGQAVAAAWVSAGGTFAAVGAMDLRLRSERFSQSDGTGGEPYACGPGAGGVCDGTTAGAVFYLAVDGVGGPASIRCWDNPGHAPSCDTERVYPAAFARQCGNR